MKDSNLIRPHCIEALDKDERGSCGAKEIIGIDVCDLENQSEI